MKTISKILQVVILATTFILVSCSSEDNPLQNNLNLSDLKLFAIDTAKVNTLSMTGMNETTILNRFINSNSYISDFSISTYGEKFVYVENQYEGTFPNGVQTCKLKISKTDGTADTVLFTSPNAETQIQAVRFCDDGKIFFSLNTQFPNQMNVLHLINADGTGDTVISGGYDIVNVSNDRKYYLLSSFNSPTLNVTVIDKTLDGGAGGQYHNEGFTSDQDFKDGVFTNDGKLLVIPFKEGNDVKIRIVDMITKTATNQTIVSGFVGSWVYFKVSMASDSHRGVLTIDGDGYIKSKSYVFDINAETVNTPFQNNDENVSNVIAY